MALEKFLLNEKESPKALVRLAPIEERSMDERSGLLERAERCRRIAERITEPTTAEALRTLADEYEQRAKAVGGEQKGLSEGDS
jgi:hypothetical protein